jgi:predicted membrane-bound spermidine synthase
MVVPVMLWAIVVGVILYLLKTDESNSPRWEHWIPPVFFISGLPALVYQIVWQRALFVVFGSNIQSVTIIVTLFILGLGLGSLLSGWLSAHLKSHLRVFAVLEMCVGLFGVFSIQIFHLVSIYSAKLSLAGTSTMVSIVLLPPTMLMGATLPMLVAHISSREPVAVGRSVGKLYFVNTLGSAIACFISAQFAMHLFGRRKMTWAAAAINILIGAFVLVRAFKSKRKTDLLAESPVATTSSRPSTSLAVALVLAFLTGFIALAYELIWYRLYSFADGGRASGFAYVLGAYLSGLSYGSLVAEVKCRKADERNHKIGIKTVGVVVVVFNILAFLVAPALAFAERFPGGEVLTLFFVAAAAGCLGSVFPLLANVSVHPGRTAGAGLGALYFTNMVGAASGSLLVGYFIFDFLPIEKASLLLAIAGIACGMVLTAAAGQPKRSLVTGAALVVIVVLLTPVLFDHLYEKLLFKGNYRPGIRFKYVVENRNGVINITPDGSVYGGGVYDGVFNTQLTHDSNHVDRCFAISSFSASPHRGLLIGLSSGSWAQILANHKFIEKLDIVEINPGYLRVIPKYPQVASLLGNPKVRIFIDDGRRWLRQNADEKYDLIVMNTTFYWRANTTNLLSVEFLSLMRQHLAPGGVFFYNTTSSGAAQLTGATVFPYALRVGNFLAVSDSPIMLDPKRLRNVLSDYKIDGRPVLDLTREPEFHKLEEIISKTEHPVKYGENQDFFSFEYADSIRTRYANARIMTDDNMGEEWQR